MEGSRQHATSQVVIGVDGGQSSTQTVLATTQGDILAAAVTGPVLHVEIEGVAEQIGHVLSQGYEKVLTAAGMDRPQVGSVCVGGGGLMNLERIRTIYRVKRVTRTGDAHVALEGAFPEDQIGIIVTAGTGSHAYGRRADGETVFVGGTGYYLGDEGSASDIAQQAFRAIYQAEDGRSEKTALTALILDHFQCGDLEQLLMNVYAETYTRHQLAQVSKLVGQAALAGDNVAVRILARAGHELGRAVAAALNTLGQTDLPFPIAPNGSVFNAGRFVTESMMVQVQKTNPRAYLADARFPPAVGAILVALRNLDLNINDEIFSHLEASMGKVFQKDSTRKDEGIFQ